MKSAQDAINEVVQIHEEALRLQREADAALVEAAVHDFSAAFSGLDRTLERECLGRLSVTQENAIAGAVENFLRSLAAKIRGEA